MKLLSTFFVLPAVLFTASRTAATGTDPFPGCGSSITKLLAYSQKQTSKRELLEKFSTQDCVKEITTALFNVSTSKKKKKALLKKIIGTIVTKDLVKHLTVTDSINDPQSSALYNALTDVKAFLEKLTLTQIANISKDLVTFTWVFCGLAELNVQHYSTKFMELNFLSDDKFLKCLTKETFINKYKNDCESIEPQHLAILGKNVTNKDNSGIMGVTSKCLQTLGEDKWKLSTYGGTADPKVVKAAVERLPPAAFEKIDEWLPFSIYNSMNKDQIENFDIFKKSDLENYCKFLDLESLPDIKATLSSIGTRNYIEELLTMIPITKIKQLNSNLLSSNPCIFEHVSLKDFIKVQKSTINADFFAKMQARQIHDLLSNQKGSMCASADVACEAYLNHKDTDTLLSNLIVSIRGFPPECKNREDFIERIQTSAIDKIQCKNLDLSGISTGSKHLTPACFALALENEKGKVSLDEQFFANAPENIFEKTATSALNNLDPDGPSFGNMKVAHLKKLMEFTKGDKSGFWTLLKRGIARAFIARNKLPAIDMLREDLAELQTWPYTFFSDDEVFQKLTKPRIVELGDALLGQDGAAELFQLPTFKALITPTQFAILYAAREYEACSELKAEMLVGVNPTTLREILPVCLSKITGWGSLDDDEKGS